MMNLGMTLVLERSGRVIPGDHPGGGANPGGVGSNGTNFVTSTSFTTTTGIGTIFSSIWSKKNVFCEEY